MSDSIDLVIENFVKFTSNLIVDLACNSNLEYKNPKNTGYRCKIPRSNLQMLVRKNGDINKAIKELSEKFYNKVKDIYDSEMAKEPLCRTQIDYFEKFIYDFGLYELFSLEYSQLMKYKNKFDELILLFFK